MRDPYVYEDCPVLKNKLGIKDGSLLDNAEVELSCNAINELLTNPIHGSYDFSHFCEFHARIFRDIYEWAGIPRTVPIEKQEAMLGYTSIEYARPNDIESETVAILHEMEITKWETLSADEQARKLSDFMAALWKIHPFREGNTRTTVTFMCQFAESKGLTLDRTLFEKMPFI